MNTSLRIIVLLTFLALLVAVSSCSHDSKQVSPAPDTTSAAEDVTHAQQLYTQRQDLMRIREAIVFLRQAITKDPGNYDAAWQLSKYDYYLATHTTDKAERDKALRDGIEAGEIAVKLQDGKPDGHFWLGANYGGAAQLSSIQGLATVDDIRNQMETVLHLNEGYQDGSAYMVLGLLYLNAPKIVGGDPNKAVELMEKGLHFGEPNALLHLHLAEAYEKVGRDGDAKKQLDTILSMKPDQDYLPEYADAADGARKLLDKLQKNAD
jgi:Tfp pilus assembly protein PilF